MKPHGYAFLLLAAAALTIGHPASAQYGTGTVLNVPYASGEITLDGYADEADWGFASFIDLTQNWSAGYWGGCPTEICGDPDNPDVFANAQMLWRPGVLYVYAELEHTRGLHFHPGPDPWKGLQLLVGVDLTHAGDGQVDDSWAGWPWNAPNLGPVAYKVQPEYGFTLNWGFDDNPDPMAQGWVDGVVRVDEEANIWAIEMAIYGAEIVGGAQVGFNIGGSSAHPDVAEYTGCCGNEWNYAYYSWQEAGNPGGDVMNNAASFASLNLTGAPGEGYGTGAVQQVPRASGAITLDGVADEAAWAGAVEVDMTNFWNSGYYEGWGDPETPDMTATARLLWDDEVLYLFIHSEHAIPMLFDPPSGSPWDSNQIIVGVDLTYEGDGQSDSSWSGWPWNAPDGPVAYKINPHFGGITLNWGDPFGENEEGVDPVDAGFVDGVVVYDEFAQTWSVEMAIFGSQIQEGNYIGFNVGGAAGNEEMCPPIGPIGECTYAWFSWQARTTSSAGGDVTFTTDSYGSLWLVAQVSAEDAATTAAPFAIRSAYPNPFRGNATLVYEMARPGAVQVALYDVLGRQVRVVDAGLRGAGEHRTTLPGADLASGLYFVRLQVDGQVVATQSILRVD